MEKPDSSCRLALVPTSCVCLSSSLSSIGLCILARPVYHHSAKQLSQPHLRPSVEHLFWGAFCFFHAVTRKEVFRLRLTGRSRTRSLKACVKRQWAL